MSGRTILITGAGGPAAVTLIRALRDDHRIVAADIDPVAVGLYLVPAERRVLLPRGDSPDFRTAVERVVAEHGVDLVIPTVDVELPSVAQAREDFLERDVRVLVEDPATLDLCLDKARLVAHCADVVRVPRTVILTEDTTAEEIASLGDRVVVKPRQGSGGRGVMLLDADPGGWPPLTRDSSLLVQEMLPGDEFSIDVLCDADGRVVACVPRRRDKVDSGIAVAGRTVLDEDLMVAGAAVAQAIGATTVVNVQVKRAQDGSPALLEVNPRFPGTMELTRAAGVDMPVLAVRAAFGEPLPHDLSPREVAMVRHWADVVVPVDEYPR